MTSVIPLGSLPQDTSHTTSSLPPHTHENKSKSKTFSPLAFETDVLAVTYLQYKCLNPHADEC